VVDRAGPPDYKPPLPQAASRAHGNAQVAQLVEHATENRSVGGSIPPLGTMTPSAVFRRSPPICQKSLIIADFSSVAFHGLHDAPAPR
jgi:hypothetical protein